MGSPLVHLELHTGDLARASAFYAQLCGWRPHRIDTRWGDYLAMGVGGEIGGGIVQCPTERPMWLPYVEVRDVHRATEHARELGGAVMLEPREGPAGWRSVVSAPDAGEIAFWQPKFTASGRSGTRA